MTRKLLSAAAAVIGLAAPTIALAQTAIVTTDLNMRIGPGPGYQVVTVIPGSQSVAIAGCIESMTWCQVTWGGQTGWTYSNYLAFDLGGTQVVIREAGPQAEIPIIAAPVAGPIAATVGTIVDAVDTAVAAITPPAHVVTYVAERTLDPVFLEGEVVVGAILPETVVLSPVPEYEYRFALVNERRVLVDPATRQVVYIVR